MTCKFLPRWLYFNLIKYFFNISILSIIDSRISVKNLKQPNKLDLY